MIYFLLLLFAGAVLTVLFWAAVVAAALLVLQALLVVFTAVWWVLTRPIVWFIVRPLEFIFGSKGNTSTKRNTSVPERIAAPTIPSQNAPTSMTEKVDQLAKIKALLESDTITKEEFDRMKGEVLAHR